MRRTDRILARMNRLGADSHHRARRRLARELHRIDAGLDRLCRLQNDIRQHRQAQAQRLADLPPDQQRQVAQSHRALIDQERIIDEQARRLQNQLAAITQRAHPHSTTAANSDQAGR